MIARFIAVGLLLIFILSGCSTIRVTEEIKEGKSIDEEVAQLVEDYGESPQELLKKLEMILNGVEHNYYGLLAGLAISLGDLDRGVEIILSNKNYFQDPELLELYINILIANGKEYEKELRQLKEIDPWNPEIGLLEAKDLIKSKKLSQAEDVLVEFYKKNPTNNSILVSLGDLYLSKVDALGLESKKVLNSREQEAITSLYKKSLEYYLLVPNPRGGLYYNKLAGIYKKLGDNVNTLKSLTKAIEYSPNDPWNYYDKGKILFYSGNNRGAIENLVIAHKLDPNNFFTNVFLGRAYFVTGEIENALRHYSFVLNENPEYYPAWVDYSILSYLMGYKEISLKYQKDVYKNRIAKDPLFPLFLMETLIELGEVENAKNIGKELARKEKDLVLKDVFILYADPYNTDDRAINSVINLDDKELRSRLSYYVALCLYREGIQGLSKTLLEEVSFFYNGYESKLAKLKLGELYE